MKISKSIQEQFISRVTENPNWEFVLQTVSLHTDRDRYLVGGRVYRTLVEIIHGYPCKSECVDWDFATTRTKKKKKSKASAYKPLSVEWTKSIWKKARSNYPNVGRQGGSIRLTSRRGGIDIIDISDIFQVADGKEPANIYGYLNSVPLSVQSIAFSLEDYTFHGTAGIESVFNRTVEIHNYDTYVAQAVHKGHVDPATYLLDKQTSLKFSVKEVNYNIISELWEKEILQRFIRQGFTSDQVKKFPGNPLWPVFRNESGVVYAAHFDNGSMYGQTYEWMGGKWVREKSKKALDKRSYKERLYGTSGTDFYTYFPTTITTTYNT